eukprot:CAMPEP_0197031796 /NCGR_PEP_ID=MMETSP1384-20130603/10680_1 /TAXON_ID=29189 /ORGANISM="Ammonia sp." /LENGTH=89 /DNA_ID=CAMNT_0042461371 /DNA_START=11 /DNA_END=280 /DNA_ORIENTATION=-
MAQGKTRQNRANKKKNATKKKKAQLKQKQRTSFAKVPKFKKNLLKSNQQLTRNINNKNHAMALQAALSHGEALKVLTHNKSTKKLKVKK